MRDDIAKALVQAQATEDPNAPPATPVPPSAFLLNQALEQQAAPQNPPMHPIVAAIMKHMGLLNMVRNQSNAALVAGDKP